METLIRHIGQLVTPEGYKALRGAAMGQLKIINNAAIYIRDGIIQQVGNDAELAAMLAHRLDEIEIISAHHKCVMPGIVDPHTHFLFAGAREKEFTNRLKGKPYLEILAEGGGICATMRATREAGEPELYAKAKALLVKMLRMGITTIEGKSGYGLDKENELKMLRVLKKLQQREPVNLVTTFLGAHAIPPEYQDNSDGYVEYIINEMLPVIAEEGLAEFTDVFCEKGVFSNEQTRKILSAAKQAGMKVKMHADEMHSSGGAGLAVDMDCFSADHLLAISEADVEKIAASDTVAVLLPATAFCMRKNFAPARKMIDKGAIVALASDYNPGSCYTYSVPLIIALAVISMNMSLEEVITAMTLNAAAAIDRAAAVGSIQPGKKADLLILDTLDYRNLVYETGINLVGQVIKDGKCVMQVDR